MTLLQNLVYICKVINNSFMKKKIKVGRPALIDPKFTIWFRIPLSIITKHGANIQKQDGGFKVVNKENLNKIVNKALGK